MSLPYRNLENLRLNWAWSLSLKAKALGTGLKGVKSRVKVEARVDEYQSSPHLTDQEHEAQGISLRPILWKSHPLCEKIRGTHP